MFIDYISKENPTTLLVVYHDQKNFDERKKVVKTLRKYAKCYDLRKLDYHDLYKMTANFK